MFHIVCAHPAVDWLMRLQSALQPGQTNRTWQSRRMLGGKGVNAARVLVRLGAKVAIYGFLPGQDYAAYSALFAREGIENRMTQTSGSARVNAKVYDPSGMTEFNTAAPPITDCEQQAFLQTFAAREADAPLLLSGSLPPGLAADFYVPLCSGLTLADTSGQPLAKLVQSGKPAVYKPNRDELSSLVGHGVFSAADALCACKEVHRQSGARVLASLGEQGAVYVGQGSCMLPPVPIAKPNPLGAGDAMAAAFLFALASGQSDIRAAQFASACAACVVESGIEGVSHQNIQKFIQYIAAQMEE